MNTLLGVFQDFILGPCLIRFHAISFTPFHDIPVINYADDNTSCFTGLTLRLGGIQWSSPATFLLSHENHFYTSPDAPEVLIKFVCAYINHVAKTF